MLSRGRRCGGQGQGRREGHIARGAIVRTYYLSFCLSFFLSRLSVFESEAQRFPVTPACRFEKLTHSQGLLD